MIVNGIIAEYNPFHNGHKYNLEQMRAKTCADYAIIVLGGNFTQRGEPAILDKFVRAKMALENGADLVIELPVSHSCSSAEFFARGGVSILDQLGCVDNLCFGSECGDVSVLRTFAEILLEEPKKYADDLKSGLAAGHSYPAARNRALFAYAPELSMYEDVLTNPNNILGIEYLKALLSYESSITPVTIPRAGSGYHDRSFGSPYVSAMAIRQAILSDNDLSMIRGQMPDSAYKDLTQCLKENPVITTSDFSHMLLYKLLTEQNDGFEKYFDVNSDLSDRIKNNVNKFDGYASFCDLLKSKNMTYARICRCLLHVLLDLKKEDLLSYGESGKIPYAKVLGFRKEAAPLLSRIQETSSIPLITKLSDARNQLSGNAYALLLKDLQRSSIYEGISALKAGREARDERQIPLVIL